VDKFYCVFSINDSGSKQFRLNKMTKSFSGTSAIRDALVYRNECFIKTAPKYWLIEIREPKDIKILHKKKTNCLTVTTRTLRDRKVSNIYAFISKHPNLECAETDLKKKYAKWCVEYNKVAKIYNSARMRLLRIVSKMELRDLKPYLQQFKDFDRALWNLSVEGHGAKQKTKEYIDQLILEIKSGENEPPIVHEELLKTKHACEMKQDLKPEQDVMNPEEDELSTCVDCGSELLFESRYVQHRQQWYYEVACSNSCFPKLTGFSTSQPSVAALYKQHLDEAA